MIIYEDKRFSFWELFNEKDGTLIRSNVNGTQKDPQMRSYPELIDVGIMGHCYAGQEGICKAAGIDCYQKGYLSHKPNMGFYDFKRIIDESKGKTFQIALGGAGDPNKHNSFEEMLSYARLNGIIPNMTTSGINILDREIELIAKYCGAVAISYYSNIAFGKETNEQTVRTITKVASLLPTNVHYVISDSSIDEAIYRLENKLWPSGISAIIFLLYKPVGFGKMDKVIKNDDRLKHFMNLALKGDYPYRIGFDTCFTPILLDFEDYYEMISIDSCEAARFSMYIDSEMNAYPCSFDNQAGKYKISLKDISIQDAWNSNIFERFRSRRTICEKCERFNYCRGGCGLELGINAGSCCH